MMHLYESLNCQFFLSTYFADIPLLRKRLIVKKKERKKLQRKRKDKKQDRRRCCLLDFIKQDFY
jgi:hypothetical protein